MHPQLMRITGRQRAAIWVGHRRWSFSAHGPGSDWVCGANSAVGNQGYESPGEATGQIESGALPLKTQPAEHR